MLTHCDNLVLIAASTGGPQTLRTVLETIGQLGCAVVIVQHTQASAHPLMLKSLQRVSGQPAQVPVAGESVECGRIYLAPCGVHLTLSGGRFGLVAGERVNHCIPSADVTMKSIGPDDFRQVTAVVLTGLGRDGAEGLRHLKSVGALCAVQEPESCVVCSMPRAALETGCVDVVLAPREIRRLIMQTAALV